MKAFEMQVCVSAERVVTLKLPDDIVPGDHRVVVVIDEPGVALPRPTLFNPEGILVGLGVKLTMDDFATNRREIWGTSTDGEADRLVRVEDLSNVEPPGAAGGVE